MEARCYKVVGGDPEDVIINDLCSLKAGISQKIIEEANRFTVKKFNFNKYFHILTSEEGNDMFKSIKYLINLNYKLQIWKKHHSENNHEPLSKDDDSSHDASDDVPPAVLHQSHRYDLEDRNPDASMTKAVNSKFNKANQNHTVVHDRNPYSEPPSRNPPAEYLETCQDIDPDDQFFQVTNMGGIEAVSDLTVSTQAQYQKVQKYLSKLEGACPPSEKSNYLTLSKLVFKLCRTLEKVDTVGFNLIDIFHFSKGNQKRAFKLFFINLDIWGSWNVNSKTDVKKQPFAMRKEAREKVELARITLER